MRNDGLRKRSRLQRVLVLSVFVLLGGISTVSQAQEEVGAAKSKPPAIIAMHEQIDWSYFCDPSHRTGYTDDLKCIALNKQRTATLSVGGEVRQRGEYFDHPTWGQEPPDSGYSLQRYMMYGDLHLGQRLRLFSELESSLAYGRDGGPRPVIDQDELFVHQTFFDLNLWKSGENSLRIRAGRQELSLGNDRLVSIREGPNVRQNFDGFRVTWQDRGWKADLLATKYSENNPGVFDDSPNHAYSFWGLYTTHQLFSVKGTNVDLYYLGTDKKKAVFAQGIGREQRETVGSRIAGKRGRLDYDTEEVFQFGRFGAGDIRAWGVASNTGFTAELPDSPTKIRIGFEGGLASGDNNLHDKTLGTYNALFPKGAYFSEAELLGPYNIVHLRPNVKIELKHNLTIWPDASFFWRQSTRDGIYGVPQKLLRPVGSSSAAYVGSHANIEIDWHPTRHFTYTFIYLHFFPGAYLKETKPGRDVNFVAPWITYSF